MSNTKIQEILAIVRRMNSDEFTEEYLTSGNELSDLYKEVKYLEKKFLKNRHKATVIIEHITNFSTGDFSNVLPISDDEDEYDVISMGLNTFREELKDSAVSIKAFDDVFNSLSTPFFIVDKSNDIITKYNEATLSFFQYKGYNKYRIKLHELFDKQFIDEIANFSASEEKKKTFEYTLLQDEQTKKLIINLSKLKSTYHLESSVTVFVTDITAQFDKEQLKNEKIILSKSLNFKDEFLANMSHEIRTPLNGIIGMTDILINDQEMAPKHCDQLRIISESSESLLTIINDVLDLSKLESGKMQLHYQDVAIGDIGQQIVSLFTPIAKSKSIGYKVDYETIKDRIFSMDKIRLLQILNNLISNAIKFTDDGDVRVEISLEGEGSDARMKFAVQDSGIGMTENEVKQLFQKFYQTDSSSTKSYKGTGLGLVICKNLVGLMKGQISVTSEPGEGSRFEFYICGELKNHERTQLDSANQVEEAAPEIDLHVLLVDDKKVNLMIAGLMLKNLGCTYDEATNGEEVLSTFKEDVYDMVLMDIQMPVMDGVTALKELKAQYSHLPIMVALTANAMEGDKEKYISMGFDDYVAKPIRQESLLEMLGRWKGRTSKEKQGM